MDDGIPGEYNAGPTQFFVSADEDSHMRANDLTAETVATEDTQPSGVFAKPANPPRETVTIEDTQPYFTQSSSVGKDYFPAGQEWTWRTDGDEEPVEEPSKNPSETTQSKMVYGLATIDNAPIMLS